MLHKLPSLHIARWNSRGIFALIAFFLIPKWRDHLKTTCDFIATTKAWFSNQHYTEDSYNQLHTAVSKLNCPKALRCFFPPSGYKNDHCSMFLAQIYGRRASCQADGRASQHLQN